VVESKSYCFVLHSIRLDAVLCVMPSENICRLRHFTNLKYAMIPVYSLAVLYL